MWHHQRSSAWSTNYCKTATCDTIKEAVHDPLTTARIAFFFSGHRSGTYSFLKKYQTTANGYLYDELGGILRSIMTRFIKMSELENANQKVWTWKCQAGMRYCQNWRYFKKMHIPRWYWFCGQKGNCWLSWLVGWIENGLPHGMLGISVEDDI